MYKKILVVFVLLSSIPLWASPLTDEKKIVLPTRVVYVSELEYFDKSQLFNALGVKHKSMFQFWKDDTATINEKLIPILPASLRAFLDSEGFYTATYTIKETNTTISIELKENEPVRVGDINISSDYDIGLLVSFEKGEIFKVKKFKSIKSKITAQLLKSGYCSFDLDNKAYVDLEKHSVNLVYNLKKGGVCTFGEVHIKGNESVPDDVIKSRVRAEKGARFSTELVRETSDALHLLAAFDSILVGVDRKFYNVVPVDITVKEMEKPYQFEAGAGYDTFVGVRVHSNIIKHNFLSDAQQLKLQLQWSQLEQLAILSFDRPVLFDIYGYFIGIGSSIGYSNLGFFGFQEDKSFFDSFFNYQDKRTLLRLGMAFEVINISLLAKTRRRHDLKIAVNEGDFLLTYPYIDYIYDARDSRLDPKFGYYFSLYNEFGFSSGDGEGIYNKLLLEGRFIHTFSKLTLSVVGIAGTITEQTRRSLPESRYFFSGGAVFNRAYGFREMGVIISPSENTIYGGSTWGNVNLEANHPISGDLYGAVFTDNTMLTASSFDFEGAIITAAGVGVRYITPIGPFKLDVGMNVADPSQFAVSFQIGQSF